MRPPDGTFKGTNFMTPTVLEYGKVCKGIWYELSEGRGMRGEPVFGMTIRKAGGGDTGDSEMFYSRRAAVEHMLSVRERIKGGAR